MKDELDKVQAEYLKLLQSITSRITTEELLELLDEVQLFWYQKRNVIHLSAQYLFRYSDAYFLTAATIFDIEDADSVFYANSTHGIIPVKEIKFGKQKFDYKLNSSVAEEFWKFYTSCD